MSDQFRSFAQCTTWCRDFSTEDKEYISLSIASFCSAVALGKKNTGRGPRERCRSASQGGVEKKNRSRTERAVSLYARSFTCVIFARFFDLHSSFFASKPHGNASHRLSRTVRAVSLCATERRLKKNYDRWRTERAVCLFLSIRYK